MIYKRRSNKSDNTWYAIPYNPCCLISFFSCCSYYRHGRDLGCVYHPRAGMKICSSLLKVCKSVTLYLQCAALICALPLHRSGANQHLEVPIKSVRVEKKINISAINIAKRAGHFDIMLLQDHQLYDNTVVHNSFFDSSLLLSLGRKGLSVTVCPGWSNA